MKKPWPMKRLGDLCQTSAGGTPLKEKKAYYEGGTIPWLLSGEVSQGEIRTSSHFITEQGLANSSAKIFPKDTVLVAMYGATAGQVGILRIEAATNQAVCGILPNEHFLPELLFYCLLSQKDALLAQATGNAQPNISQIKIRNLEVPLIPLAEQRRMVAFLDEAFEGLARAKANVETNLQNAQALFERHVHTALTEPRDGWVERRLGDLCEIKTGKKDVKQGNPSGAFPFFTCAAEHTYSDTYSFDTEALLVAGNGNVGQTQYYVGKFEVYQRTYVLSGFRGVDARYLFRALDKRLSAKVSKHKLGNTMPYIKIGMLADFVVPVPPAEEQARITAHLDSFAEETSRLIALYQRKLAALNELKQSLLHQAFAAQLATAVRLV